MNPSDPNQPANSTETPGAHAIAGLDPDEAARCLRESDPEFAIQALAAAGARVRPDRDKYLVATSICRMAIMTQEGRWFDFEESMGGRGALSLLQSALDITDQEAALYLVQWAHPRRTKKAPRRAAPCAYTTKPPFLPHACKAPPQPAKPLF